jgi:hypothetical protein
VKLTVFELDYSASSIDIGISHRSMDVKAPKQMHMTANRHFNRSNIPSAYNRRERPL